MARGKFQNIVETVGDTPIVKINHLAPDHVTMWAKIEAFNPLGSVKDRLAMGIIEAAEASGELKPGQTVIEATSGNTGIGLAMVCAAKGYPFVSVMVETFSVERRKLMRMLGAKVPVLRAAYMDMRMSHGHAHVCVACVDLLVLRRGCSSRRGVCRVRTCAR